VNAPESWKMVIGTKAEVQLPREIAEHAGGFISFDPTISIGVGSGRGSTPVRWLKLNLALRYAQSEAGKAVRSRRRLYIGSPLLLLPSGGILESDLHNLTTAERTIEMKRRSIPGVDGGPEFVIDLLTLYKAVQAKRRTAVAAGATLTEQFDEHTNESRRTRSFAWPWARKGAACRES